MPEEYISHQRFDALEEAVLSCLICVVMAAMAANPDIIQIGVVDFAGRVSIETISRSSRLGPLLRRHCSTAGLDIENVVFYNDNDNDLSPAHAHVDDTCRNLGICEHHLLWMRMRICN